MTKEELEKEAEEIMNNHCDCEMLSECLAGIRTRCTDFEESKKLLIEGIEFGYNKANERHSPDEHIDKGRVVLGIIKLCNKTRYSLVQFNGEWWYQYGSFNAEVRLIAWYNIPELPKEIE